MDPASIIGLIGASVGLVDHSMKVGAFIQTFIRKCNDASRDLTATAMHLSQLELTMSLLKDELSEQPPNSTIPATTTSQIISIVKECESLLTEIDDVLTKYSARSNIRWAASGQQKVSDLNKIMDAHIRSLGLSFDYVKLYVLRQIKEDTSHIRTGVDDIKDDTKMIPEMRDEIDRLREDIQRLRLERDPQSHEKSATLAVEDWLETMTTDLETARVQSSKDHEGVAEPSLLAPETPGLSRQSHAVTNPKELKSFPKRLKHSRLEHFSPDGKLLSSISKNMLSIYTLPQSKSPRTFTLKSISPELKAKCGYWVGAEWEAIFTSWDNGLASITHATTGKEFQWGQEFAKYMELIDGGSMVKFKLHQYFLHDADASLFFLALNLADKNKGYVLIQTRIKCGELRVEFDSAMHFKTKQEYYAYGDSINNRPSHHYIYATINTRISLLKQKHNITGCTKSTLRELDGLKVEKWKSRPNATDDELATVYKVAKDVPAPSNFFPGQPSPTITSVHVIMLSRRMAWAVAYIGTDGSEVGTYLGIWNVKTRETLVDPIPLPGYPRFEEIGDKRLKCQYAGQYLLLRVTGQGCKIWDLGITLPL